MQAPVKLRAGIIGSALAFYLLLQILAQFPELVEKYYSNGLYPILTWVISTIAGQFYFSVTEFMLWFFILIGLPLTIDRIRKKRQSLGRVILNLLTLVSVGFVWFYLFWGINYFRMPLKAKLNLTEVNLPMNAFDSTFTRIIKSCNDLSFAYSISDIETLSAEIDSSYNQVFDQLNLQRVRGYKGLKSFAFNWMLNKTTTSGWFSPFFHEVHYNTDLLIYELPFVIAHEKAHQKGYTSEAEANFLAFLVCTNSDNRLCQYSGYFQVLNYFFRTLAGDEEKTAFYTAQLNRGVLFNRAEVQQRWSRHIGLISELSDKGYDLYLRSNRVKEGINSYALVVDYIVRFDMHQPSLLGRR